MPSEFLLLWFHRGSGELNGGSQALRDERWGRVRDLGRVLRSTVEARGLATLAAVYGCSRGRPLVIMHGSDGATALFDMAGFVVGAQVLEDGEWWLSIETSADVVGCSDCGRAAVGHGRRIVLVRDLPIVGRPVRVVWRKRIWRCPDGDCATRRGARHTTRSQPRASLTRAGLTCPNPQPDHHGPDNHRAAHRAAPGGSLPSQTLPSRGKLRSPQL